MKTIRKVGQILRLFSATLPEHSTSELSRELGLSTSGTHDLVDALAQIGLLRKIDRGRYRLGPLITTLYRAMEDSSALVEAARPIMTALVKDHGETLHLTLQDQGRLLVLAANEGTRALRVCKDVLESPLPLHNTAAGLIHLSGLTHAALENWLDEHAHPGASIVSRSTFRNQLAEIATDGFFAAPLGREPDVVCIAAAVYGHSNQPLAVLSMVVPESRYARQPRAFRGVVVEATALVSQQLGDNPKAN
ncbi:IclR family transcriptional regulator [Rhizobium lusitanum]|uniref:IclR family transcriptional regulator n=1 Tax=Rhizobium lusitanum TaxID=293958 RepID=UPI00195CEFB1|nr:IclR family transcriptional regulator C-terminal domain-containing protein [Rhizobium lusitanum]MBM7046109.1 helix-turn-helix domain-containing protein [Rhizobium lusitanum]